MKKKENIKAFRFLLIFLCVVFSLVGLVLFQENIIGFKNIFWIFYDDIDEEENFLFYPFINDAIFTCVFVMRVLFYIV